MFASLIVHRRVRPLHAVPPLIAGFTPRELAMQCDFYECADLIDELARVQLQQEVARIKESRIKGTNPTNPTNPRVAHNLSVQ